MEGFKNSVYAKAAENIKEIVDESGIHSAGEKILEEARIHPDYVLERTDPDAFAENRHKLNTEAGLIIANHPGHYDTFLILNTLKRKDIKIVVSDSNYKTFAPTIGEEFLIKATHNPSEALSFLRSIKEHVEAGGIVLVYPTGGSDRVDKDNSAFAFENGFSIILKRCLKPTDMVYSFYIEPTDIASIVDEKIPRNVGVVSAVAVHPATNINQTKKEVTVRVSEQYSTTAEWQQTITNSNKEERNAVLQEHFMQSFRE